MPIGSATARTCLPRSDSSRPYTVRMCSGNSGRNMSTFKSATIWSGFHGGMRREIFRSQQPFLLAGNNHEEQGTPQLRFRLVQLLRDIQQRRHTRCIIHRAVVNLVAVDRLADAQMIQVRRKHHVFDLSTADPIPAEPPPHSAIPPWTVSPQPWLAAPRLSGKCGSSLRSLASARISSAECPDPASHLSRCAGLIVTPSFCPNDSSRSA